MKHLIRLFKYSGKNVVTNMDFSQIPLNDNAKNPGLYPDVPLAVRSAKTFETRQALDKYCYANKVNTIVVKCAYEPSVHVGVDQRMVARNAIYGNFGDKAKTPFIVENLHIHGNGKNAYYTGIKQLVELKDHDRNAWRNPPPPLYTWQEYMDSHRPPVKRGNTNFQAYHWIPCKIPLNSTIGTIIYWSEFLENPDIILYKDLDILKNHTIKFRDKRPNYRENLAPDGTHAGQKGASCPLDNTPKKYYLVKFVDSKTGEIHWKRQNNCQLRDIDIKAEIAAGNIKEL